MKDFLNDFTEFIFGKGLKLILLFFGIMSFVTFINHKTQVGFAILAVGFIFSAVYLSIHERNKPN